MPGRHRGVHSPGSWGRDARPGYLVGRVVACRAALGTA